MRDWINLIESFGRAIDWNPRAQSPNLQLFNLDIAASNGSITEKEIKEFASFLRSHKMDFVRMYHATSADHPVPEQGLLPTSATRAKSLQSEHGYVYLSYGPESALSFARMAYAGKYKPLVVYAVDITIGRLKPDTDQLRNKRLYAGIQVGNTLAESLIFGRGARVQGKIDPMSISIFGYYDHHGHPLEEAKINEAKTIDASDFIIYQNPTKSQLIGLVQRYGDLRGLVIGNDLFLADAFQTIHMHISDKLEMMGYLDGKLDQKCYFYDPTLSKRGKYSDDWCGFSAQSRFGVKTYMLEPNLFGAFDRDDFENGMDGVAINRLMRTAKRISFKGNDDYIVIERPQP